MISLVHKIMITGLVFSSLSFSVSAKQSAIDSCAGNTTQTAINQCSTAVFNKSELNLKKLISNYAKELTTAEQEQLNKSQKLWSQFREVDCKFESSTLTKGSMYPFAYNSCMTKRTENRIVEIQNMLECKNGTEPGCL